MPTPGSLLRHAARAAPAARRSAASTRTSRRCASCEILVDGDKEHRYLLQIFLKESASLYDDREAGPFFFEIIQRKGRPGLRRAATSARCSRASSASRRPGRICRGSCSSVASSGRSRGSTTSRCATTRASLRYEECLTRDGFDGPVHHPATTSGRRTRSAGARRSTAGRCRSPRAARRRWRKRHYQIAGARAGRGGRRSTRGCRCSSTPTWCSGWCSPTRRDPVYFANGDGDELFYIHEGGGTLRTRARRPALRRRTTTCSSRAGCVHRFIPDPAAAVLAVDRVHGGLHLPEAVAQRGRPAADGRALLPPRLPASRVHGADATRASATWW